MKYEIGCYIQDAQKIDSILEFFENNLQSALAAFLTKSEIDTFVTKEDLIIVLAIKEAIINVVGAKLFFEKCNYEDIIINKDEHNNFHINITEELHVYSLINDIDFTITVNEEKSKVSVFVLIEFLQNKGRNISIKEKGKV